MTWTRLDDAVYDHPKLAEVDEPAARLLWVWSICWSNRHGTNGFLPLKSMRNLASISGVQDLHEAAAELTLAGLWIVAEDGWEVHDFLDYQPDATKAADLAKKRSAAGQRGGINSGKTRSKPEANASNKSKQVASQLLRQKRTPSRPVPSPITDVSSSSGPVQQEPPPGRDEDDLIDLTQELEAAWSTHPPIENSPPDDPATSRAWDAVIEGGELDLRRAVASGRDIGAPARYALACAKDRWTMAGPRLVATALAQPDLSGLALLAAADEAQAVAMAARPAGGHQPPGGAPPAPPRPACGTCGQPAHQLGTCPWEGMTRAEIDAELEAIRRDLEERGDQ